MAEAMLIGAGLGAGGAMLSGQDPLKGAAIGGAMGGASAGFGSAGVASGASAGAANGASHLAQSGAQQAAANAGSSGLGATIGSGFTDLTGMTGQDVAQMGVQEGIRQVATPPPPEQAIQHAQPSISQPQVDLSQGTPVMNSNPRIKKLQMQGLL
jgi:hypothetical protein